MGSAIMLIIADAAAKVSVLNGGAPMGSQRSVATDLACCELCRRNKRWWDCCGSARLRLRLDLDVAGDAQSGGQDVAVSAMEAKCSCTFGSPYPQKDGGPHPRLHGLPILCLIAFSTSLRTFFPV